MADYKAAYEREREARKRAELSLETRARDLYLANKQLTAQFEKIGLESQQKSLLLNIYSYSQESLKLGDFLPEIIAAMLKMANIPFGVFDYLPLNSQRENYRSPIFVNQKLAITRDIKQPTSAHIIDDALNSVSVDVIFDRKAVYVRDLVSKVDGVIADEIRRFDIAGLLAIPVVANNHTAAIIYLLVGNEGLDKDGLLALFETSIKQLGILIEHRYSVNELENNYGQLKSIINELNHTQKQLLQSEKLASIGQLSAGIAHEINNPMSFVKSNLNSLTDYQAVFSQALRLMKMSLTASESDIQEKGYLIQQLAEYWRSNDIDFLIEDAPNLLQETHQGLDRVVKIVSGLKSFSRTAAEEWSDCDLNACINNALKLAHNELKYKCTVKKYLAELPNIQGNAGELEQVILNLLINAGQAIEQSGDITISTKAVDGGVEMTLADTGAGIDEEHMQKIFDPFFTTKDVGKGTGLGLSISFGIIESHQGRISVDSVQGEGSGTKFKIWLPANH
jgi:signal transduction histidine kinase